MVSPSRNGHVSYNQGSINGQYPVGTKASFECSSGYRLEGSASRTCQNSGYFNHWTFCEQSNKKLNCRKSFHFHLLF